MPLVGLSHGHMPVDFDALRLFAFAHALVARVGKDIGFLSVHQRMRLRHVDSRLCVLLVLRSNPLSSRLICFMPSMSHVRPLAPRLCRPSLGVDGMEGSLVIRSNAYGAPSASAGKTSVT